MTEPIHRRRRLHAVAALTVLWVLVLATPALAHVELADSDPPDGALIEATIDEITLEFTVAAAIAGDGVVLYGEDGAPIDANIRQVSDTVVVVAPTAPLNDGLFAVTWSMQSGDAHPVSGGIEFAVAADAAAAATTTPTDGGGPGVSGTGVRGVDAGDGISLLDSVLDEPGSPTGRLAATVGRSAMITATLLGIGALAFGALVLRGSRREAEAVGYWMRRSGAAILLATPVLVIGRILETGTGSLGPIALETVLQIAGGVALLAGTRIVTVPEPSERLGGTHAQAPMATMTAQRFRVGSSPAALAGMVALVLAFALDGHSGALQPTWLMTLGSMVHVIAAAVWLGGVALIGRTLLGRARDGERLEVASLVIPFSAVAAAAVTAVGLAGAAMALVIADGIATFFTTPWGWAMLAKLAFVGVAGGIGAYNHFVLVPMLRNDTDHPLAAPAILRTVRVEIVCLIAAAAITGALVGLSAV